MIEYIRENYPDLLVADGFDDCIIGVSHSIGQEDRVAYSTQKILDKLVSEGMEYSDAVEHFEYNIAGAYVGEHTQCFVDEGMYE